jgi:Acetyltransferase (GNAT) family
LNSLSAVEPAFDRGLVARLETAHAWAVNNYVECLKQRRPQAGATALRVADGRAFFAGLSPFSFAVGLGLCGPLTAAALDEVEAFYAERGVACKVDVTPATDQSVTELLKDREYRIADLTSVLSLATDDFDFGPVAPEIELRWAGDDDCDLWVDTIARNFYVTDPGAERRLNMACVFHACHALNVIATVAGELAGVAGCMVPHGGGMAMIYGSCTVAEFRRLGVHREMLRVRVETARAAGCDSVVATALPGSDSERNLERCGFRSWYVKTSWAK